MNLKTKRILLASNILSIVLLSFSGFIYDVMLSEVIITLCGAFSVVSIILWLSAQFASISVVYQPYKSGVDGHAQWYAVGQFHKSFSKGKFKWIDYLSNILVVIYLNKKYINKLSNSIRMNMPYNCVNKIQEKDLSLCTRYLFSNIIVDRKNLMKLRLKYPKYFTEEWMVE